MEKKIDIREQKFDWKLIGDSYKLYRKSDQRIMGSVNEVPKEIFTATFEVDGTVSMGMFITQEAACAELLRYTILLGWAE